MNNFDLEFINNLPHHLLNKILLYAFSISDYLNISKSCNLWKNIIFSEYFLTQLIKCGRISPETILSNEGLRDIIVNGRFYNVIVCLLIDSTYDPSSNKNFAARWITKAGNDRLFNKLLDDPRVDPSDNNNKCIQLACKNGNFKIVQLLLNDIRVDPSINNNYCIRIATKYQFPNIVQCLIKHPLVDLTVNNNYPFKKAIRSGNFRLVQIFLDCNKINYQISNHYAIKIASTICQYDIINILLSLYSLTDIIKDLSLIKRVCKISKKNRFISEDIRIKCINLLVNFGVNPLIDAHKSLLYCSKAGYYRIIQMLLSFNCKPNIEHLEAASKNGYLEIIKLLLPLTEINCQSDKFDDFMITLTDVFYNNIESENYNNIINTFINDSRIDLSAANNYLLRQSIKYQNKNLTNRLLKINNLINF